MSDNLTFAKSFLFSWQKKDESIIKNKIKESKVLAIKSKDLDFNQLFLYGIFKELAPFLNLKRNDFNLPFFPFYESFNEYNKCSWHQLTLKGLLSSIVLDLTESETLKYIIENIGKKDFLLDETSQGIVSTLIKIISLHKKLTIVCSYPHLFDDNSKQLLKFLQNTNFLKKYPKTNNITLIFLSDTFEDDFYKDIHNFHDIMDPEENNIDEIFQFFGEYNLDYNMKQSIFQICEKRLNKIQYLIENITFKDAAFTIKNFDNEINEILADKIKNIGKMSQDVQNVLNTASEIGEFFDILPLIKALDSDKAFIEDMLDISEKYNLTIKNKNTVKFANIYVKHYFENLTKYKRTINKCIANAYAELYPSNYEIRLYFLEKSSSEMLNEVCDILILIWLSYQRNNVECSSDLMIKLNNYAEKFNRTEYLKTMSSFFTFFDEQNFENALSVLNSYSELDTPILLLEKDYLIGLTSYKLGRNKEDLRDAIVNMENVRNKSRAISVALYERSSLTLLSFIINVTGDTNQAKLIEKDIIYNLSKRIDYDSAAKDNLHRIYRKYAALYPVELAAEKTERSLNYFEKTPLTNEYYMAVVNHIGNLLHIGKYNEAYSFSQLLYCYMDIFYNFKNKKLIIYSLNNILISFYLKAEEIPYNFLTQYNTLLDSIPENPSKIIPYITLSIIFCDLFENSSYAKELLNKSKQLNSGISDSYYEYYIAVNEAAILYLDKNTRNEGITILENIKNYYPALTKEAMRTTLLERAEIILANMRNEKSKEHIEKDLSMRTCKYTMIMHYYLFSDIQFWSE